MQGEEVQAKTKQHNNNGRYQPDRGHKPRTQAQDKETREQQGHKRQGRQRARVSKGPINRDNHGAHPRKTTGAKGSNRTTQCTTAVAEEP